MPVIQKLTPARDSLCWELLHRFYQDQGPDAWKNKLVPQGSTANCYTADTYAAIVAAFFRDLIAEGNSEPPVVIELGGGSGRFAWQFLNRLFNYHFIDGEECPAFTYLLTDAAKRNIDNWAAKQRFQPLVESGVLEFAQLWIESDPIIRTAGGNKTPADYADRPVIIIANYLFDSIPANILRVNHHEIEQVSVSLMSTEPDFLERPITSFASITDELVSGPLEGEPSDHPLLNSILHSYAELDGDFNVVVPEIGFHFLEKFLDRETPLLFLSGDLAYSNPREFTLRSPLIFDSYFAHYTNFHIFAELFRHYGGQTQFQRHTDTDFSCGAFMLGGKGPWATIDLAETRKIAASCLRDFYPYDAHELSEMIEESVNEASIRQVIAWIRFSKFDPAVAEACLPFVFYQIEQGEDQIDPIQLYEIFMESYRSFFPDGSPVSIDCGIAELCMGVGYHAHALDLIRQSTAEFGESAQRLLIQALAKLRLGDEAGAHELVKRSLTLDPNFIPALRLMQDKFTPRKQQRATAKAASPYAHMQVGFTDPQAVPKASALLKERGAVLIEQIISPEIVAELRVAFDERVKDWRQSGLGKPNNVGDRRFTVPIRIQAPFDNPAVYANPVLLGVMTELMGERPVLHAFGGVATYAGARMQHIHREHPLLFNTDEANAAVPLYATTILVPLIDLDEECGGTQFWHSTHKLPKDGDWEGDPEIVYTKAGSALVLDYRTYHGGMPCLADHGRPMLYYTYAMPWFVDTMAFESHAALGLTDAERMSLPGSDRELFKFAKRIAA